MCSDDVVTGAVAAWPARELGSTNRLARCDLYGERKVVGVCTDCVNYRKQNTRALTPLPVASYVCFLVKRLILTEQHGTALCFIMISPFELCQFLRC